MGLLFVDAWVKIEAERNFECLVVLLCFVFIDYEVLKNRFFYLQNVKM